MNDRQPYRTIEGMVRHEIEPIKKSRFITQARHVTSETEAMAQIETARKRMPDAAHHCWAYQLRNPAAIKCSDDGEPGGSAGRPILAQLTGRKLYDIVVVVTRYFGGVKLGVGGLARAYGGAAAKTLDIARIITITPKRLLEIVYSYDDTARVDAALHHLGLTPARTDYAAQVSSLLEVPDSDWQTVRQVLSEHSGGRVRFVVMD